MDDPGGLTILIQRFAQKRAPIEFPGIGGERGFGFLQRGEDCSLIGAKGGPVRGLGLPHPSRDPQQVGKTPGHEWPGAPTHSGVRSKAATLQACCAAARAKADARQQVRTGKANACACRGQAALGFAHIGATGKQFRAVPDRNNRFEGGRRFAGFGRLGRLGRRHAKQCCQPKQRRQARGFKDRDCGFALGHEGARLGECAWAIPASQHAALRDAERLLLEIPGFLRDGELAGRRATIGVGAGGFSRDAHTHALIGGARCGRIGAGGGNRLADAPEEIDLIGDINTGVIDRAIGQRRGCT